MTIWEMLFYNFQNTAGKQSFAYFSSCTHTRGGWGCSHCRVCVIEYRVPGDRFCGPSLRLQWSLFLMGQIKCTMTPCECHDHPLWVTVKWTLLCSSIWIGLHLEGRGTKLISTLFMTTARTKATTSRGLGAQAPISAILLDRHHRYLCFTDAIPYLKGHRAHACQSRTE